MGQLWYYEESGATEGPLEIDQLRALITDGTLTDDSQVKSESMQQWVSVSSLRDEIDAVGEPNAASHDDLDDRNSGLNIDDFNLESGGDPDEDMPDIDSFVVAGDNDSPKPEYVSSHKPKDPEPEPEEEAEEEFLVRSLGMTLGPLTYDEIVDMARTGSLTKGDEIKVGESEWIAVESIAQVSTAVEESSAGESSAGESTAGDSTAGKKSSAGKPRKKATRKSSAGKSSAGRKRRRKKKKKDEFLAEIFAEVFTEDGKVRHERIAAAATPAAPAAVMGDAANPQMMAGAQPGMQAGAQPGMQAGGMQPGAGMQPGMAAGGMNGMNGMGSPDYASQQAAHPAFKAPPKPKAKPKAKSKSKGGQNFEMPEPKVLGMIGGGVLAVLILLGGYTGILPIPGFGVDPDTFFKEVAEVYPIVAAGDKAKWKMFQKEYGSMAEDIKQALAESAKSDPTAKRHYNAAKAVVTLTQQPHDYPEGKKEAFREFQKILVGG